MTTMLSVSRLHCEFDVSGPFLTRVLSGSKRRILRAVQDVSFEVPRGTVYGLVGESGCGKSTLAKLIVGLEEAGSGSILFDGVEVGAGAGRQARSSVRGRMQMIFQDPYASLNPRWRVREIIGEPIRVRGLMTSERLIRGRVDELLALVGLSPEDARKYPHQFSGGQRQRISIARALAGEPEFLVCDEPTSALDVSMQAQVLNLMRRLQRKLGLTYLFISHNLGVIHHLADSVGVMYLGRLVESGPTRTVFRQPLHPYTRMLLEAIPSLDEPDKPHPTILGEVPSPIDPPPGCAFHQRCPLAMDRCRVDVPVMRTFDGQKVACHAVS
jgi:peptide/nickel transport system ATP-binding protein